MVFTHLQASYDAANTENADIRADQLGVVRDQIRKLSELRVQQYAGTVVVGDLNIKGDPDDTTGERNSVFSATPDTFGNEFDDAWRASMHPPGDPKDYDPGYTQRDTPTYQPSRFDYQCVSGETRRRRRLGHAPHVRAYSLAERNHRSLGAIRNLHRLSPNCTPALAIDLLGTDPVNKNAPSRLSLAARHQLP